MAATWKIGDRIQNRYEVHRVLRGGMGIVYVVYDHDEREPLALKTFQEAVFARNPAIAERFLQEARTWINLDRHQNVAQARFAFRVGSQPFLVLEYVDGGDLGAWIGTPRLTDDLPRVLRFAIQFCDGMGHALSKGIRAHRDVKPQNCLIGSDGSLKVTDFGLAKVVGDVEADVSAEQPAQGGGLFRRILQSEGARSILSSLEAAGIGLSQTGRAAGTPAYMAPEQFDDAKHVDVPADVYAFGVMLFEMIAGRRPFDGRTWQELERLHKTQPPPPLAVPRAPELSTLVGTCLAKDPSGRYAGFGPIRERLAANYEALTGRAAPRPAEGIELDAEAWALKASGLVNLRRFGEAAEAYGRAIELDQGNAVAYGSLGALLGSLGGDQQQALGLLDHAIRLDPTLATAWQNKGETLSAMGQLADALRCHDEAVRLDPRDAMAWAARGDVLGQLGRFAEAVESFNRAVALNPHTEAIWNNFGVVWDKQEQWHQSLACYDRAIALDRDCASAWYNRGTPLAKLMRQKDAIASVEQAARLGHEAARGTLEILRQQMPGYR